VTASAVWYGRRMRKRSGLGVIGDGQRVRDVLFMAMIASIASNTVGCGEDKKSELSPEAGSAAGGMSNGGAPSNGGTPGSGGVTGMDAGRGVDEDGGGAGGKGGVAGSAGSAGSGDGDSSAPHELDPAGDEDGDGLTNGVERKLLLDPESWDTDDDGLTDPDEVGAAAKPKDTDGDGVIDALESDLTDNDLDGIYDTTDPASGWQVAAGRFFPRAIANDGKDATRVEVVVTGAGVSRVALKTPSNFYDPTVLPSELVVDGKALGDGALDLFDDGTHGDRFADDGIWSHDAITTKMAIHSPTGGRDWVVFLEVMVTTAKGAEERFLGVPAPNATSDSVLQRSMGFYLGVVDASAVVVPKVLKPTLIKTPHLMNIVDAKAAVGLKRRFLAASEAGAATAAEIFRPVLDAIPGDVDFVSVFPESSARGSQAGNYTRASVDAAGTGLPVQPPSAGWGSEAGKVKGGILLDFSLDAPLNHEILHHWGVYLSASLGFGDGESHWGVAGTYGVLGGFDPKTFVDNKDGTYSVGFFSIAGNDWRTTPLSPIELYLAGLAAPSEVLPITTMQDATVVDRTNTAVIVKGTKKTTTIEQIVAQHGARVPSSKDSQKAFAMAFAVYSEKPLSSSEMSWLDVYADFFGRKDLTGSMSFSEATSGRATMNTTLPKLVGE
jgi:hypothetical protein